MFYKKLEIKYHLPATRFLLIVGDIFLLTFTLLTTRERLCDMWDSVIDIRDVQLASICAGVSWSLICALWAAASLCKCTKRQRTSPFSTVQKDVEAAMRPAFITKNLYPLLPVVPKNASKDEEKNGLPKKSSRIENLDEEKNGLPKKS